MGEMVQQDAELTKRRDELRRLSKQQDDFITELKGNIQKLESELQVMLQRRQTLEQKMVALEDKNKTLTRKLERRSARPSKRIDGLNQELKVAKREIERLSTDNAALARSVVETKEKITELKGLRDELLEEKEALTNETSVLKLERKEDKVEINKLVRELDDMSRSFSRTQDEVNEFHHKLEKEQKRKVDLETEVAKLKEELSLKGTGMVERQRRISFTETGLMILKQLKIFMKRTSNNF